MKTKNLFVYGGLMAKHQDKKTAFPAYLAGYKISFTVKGLKPFEPSFAALIPTENSRAYGIIIRISVDKLKKYIAHEVSYSVKEIEATDRQGNNHSCVALFLNKTGYIEEVLPSARYAHQLYKGACYHDLPEEVLRYYLSLKKKGNKLTYFLRFLFPFYLKCVPILGRYPAFYGIMILLPSVLLIVTLLLIIRYIL